jgi:hypothetical protein
MHVSGRGAGGLDDIRNYVASTVVLRDMQTVGDVRATTYRCTWAPLAAGASDSREERTNTRACRHWGAAFGREAKALLS